MRSTGCVGGVSSRRGDESRVARNDWKAVLRRAGAANSTILSMPWRRARSRNQHMMEPSGVSALSATHHFAMFPFLNRGDTGAGAWGTLFDHTLSRYGQDCRSWLMAARGIPLPRGAAGDRPLTTS